MCNFFSWERKLNLMHFYQGTPCPRYLLGSIAGCSMSWGMSSNPRTSGVMQMNVFQPPLLSSNSPSQLCLSLSQANSFAPVNESFGLALHTLSTSHSCICQHKWTMLFPFPLSYPTDHTLPPCQLLVSLWDSNPVSPLPGSPLLFPWATLGLCSALPL